MSLPKTVRPRPEPRLAIAAIFKNEGPYVLEWIAHHRVLGIDHFFIADNGSTDHTTALLAALALAGVVTHIPFPTVGRPPQQAAYQEILRRFGHKADWIAFIDADEFLVPAPPLTSIRPPILALDRDPTIGAIAVNWAVYGSSGHRAAGAAPVAARFTRRAEQAHPMNRHYKSILRPDACARPITNVHHLPLRPGFRAVQADGAALESPPAAAEGLSRRTVWQPLRLNHYVIKSWEEFHTRKRARGRATRFNAPRNEMFFRVHDRNEVADPMPAWLLAATEAERRRLARWVGLGRALGLALIAFRPSWWRPRLGALVRRASRRPRGAIDQVVVEAAAIRVGGWALVGGRLPAEAFGVEIDGAAVRLIQAEASRREDVGRLLPGAARDCGFELWVERPLGLDPAAPPALTVTARCRRRALRIAARRTLAWQVAPGEVAQRPSPAPLPAPRPVG